ncbi:MAG: DUF4430 domain-containing protein [Acholeplasmatales bacterium]|nr:MAG: DUF4430 domain-containing protein [Acholeplasmatales bacterium]
MKKLFSLMLTALAILVLASCDNLEVRRMEPVTDTPSEDLLTLIVETDQGPIEQQINLQDANEATVFDLLVEYFDVNYMMFDFGPMLLSIESLVPGYGAFISITHNGEPSLVGAQDIVYEAGDVITFEIAWWDMTMKAVREAIEAVQAAGIEMYFLNHPNLYVGAALYHLGLHETLSARLDLTYGPVTEGQLSQAILLYHLSDADTTTWLAALDGIKTIAWPYATSLTVMALSTAPNAAEVHATFFDDYVNDVAGRDLTTLDPDTLVLTYLALIALPGETGSVLSEAVLDAIVATLHTSSFGPNAATTAHQIIALTAAGLDARAASYHHDGTDLIEQLLGFHDDAGAFYWNDDSAHVDLMFSTPQAWLALVLYEAFMQQHSPIHPFIPQP